MYGQSPNIKSPFPRRSCLSHLTAASCAQGLLCHYAAFQCTEARSDDLRSHVSTSDDIDPLCSCADILPPLSRSTAPICLRTAHWSLPPTSPLTILLDVTPNTRARVAHEYKQCETRDSDALLWSIGETTTAVDQEKLVEDFIAKFDESDPAPVWYSLQWWLQLLYHAEPKRYVILVVPDEELRTAFRKFCKRWEGSVGVLRASYVCLVRRRDMVDNFMQDLERDSKLGSIKKVWVYCAAGSRHEMDAIAAPSRFSVQYDASNPYDREPRRLLLHWQADTRQSITIDPVTVDTQHPDGAASPASQRSTDQDRNSGNSESWKHPYAYLAAIVSVACVADCLINTIYDFAGRHSSVMHGGELQHGESHNRGKSQQRSVLKVRYDIQAGGNVTISTPTHHGCEANPLSSSSPTVGNNQPNGNEGLSQDK